MAEFGRVLITRHPETVSNVEHFFSGRMDVALTDRGRRQAVQAAEAIAAWRPDRILTSPLSRCRAIADDAAARLGIEPVVDDRLVEIEFGAIEGVRLDKIRELGRFWNHVIVNVSSMVYVSDGSRLSLQTAGLMPDELKARAELGFVPGGDVGVLPREPEDDLSRAVDHITNAKEH